MASEERLRELEDKYEGYTVYDNRGDKIGKVDDLFIDETDREEYIGVKMGFFGRKSTLIPMDIVRVNEADRSLEVSESKDHVKDAPNFDDDEDVTPEYEERIRSHFGLQSQSSSSSQGSYGASTGTAAGAEEGRESDQAHSDREGGDQGYADSEDRTQAESTQGEQSATGYEERSGSSTGSSGTGETGDAERESSSTDTSAGGPTGAAGRFERREPAGSQQTSQETTGEAPRAPQMGETETVEEGGRARVRRRIIREEIIEEDPDARS